jgi:hypothetical protein
MSKKKSNFSHVQFPNCAKEFFEIIRMSYPDNTARAYRTTLKRFYEFLNHQHRLSMAELEHRHIQKWVAEMGCVCGSGLLRLKFEMKMDESSLAISYVILTLLNFLTLE